MVVPSALNRDSVRSNRTRAANKRKNTMICEICGADEVDSEHHLIPRTLHKNKWFKKHFAREQLHITIGVCKSCHRAVHNITDNKTLGREYNTLAKLKTHLVNHIAWRKKTNKVKTWRRRRP